MESYLTDEVRAMVGRKSEPRTGLVTSYAIRKFCAAIDEKDPVYLDREAARKAGFDDVISPPLFNASALRPAPHRDGLLNDGQYDNVAPPGLGHLQTMLAGYAWETYRPAVAGEEIRETFTITSITERQGKTGPIVFMEREALVETKDGDPLERYTNLTLLRKAPPPLPPFQGDDQKQAPQADFTATSWADGNLIKRPDMIQLFMFSAAIWAVHRIHWDVPYAQEEGLKLPVLPGWMLSCYLTQLAKAKAPQGHRLKKLDHRYRASGHPGDTLTGSASPGAETNSVDLKLENQDGVQLITGTSAFEPA